MTFISADSKPTLVAINQEGQTFLISVNGDYLAISEDYGQDFSCITIKNLTCFVQHPRHVTKTLAYLKNKIRIKLEIDPQHLEANDLTYMDIQL